MAKSGVALAQPSADPVRIGYVIFRDGGAWALHEVPIPDSYVREHGETLRHGDTLAACLAVAHNHMSRAVDK
jgi:hypothetical protein